MAQRQLISLVRRVRSSSLHSFLDHHRAIADRPFFHKIDKELFSAAAKPTQRQTGGKVPDSPDKRASFQKQGTGKPVPLTAGKVSDNHTENNTSEKSSSNYFLVVGAFSALFIGLYTLYPWDLLKKLYVEEKKEEEPQVLSEDADPVKSNDVSLLTSSEVEEKRDSLNELNHQQHIAKGDESSNEGLTMEENSTQDGETGHAQNTENLNLLAAPTKVESKATETNSLADDIHTAENISRLTSNGHKISEPHLKDEVTQSIGHVPDGDILPANSSHDLNSNQTPMNSGKEDDHQVSSTSRKEEDLVSSLNTLSPISDKESEVEDLTNNGEPNLLQAPLKGTMRRPNLVDAYYLANRGGNGTHMHKEEQVTQNNDELNSQKHEGREKPSGIKGVLVDGAYTDPVHNVFDLLEVVHAAEQRQAELDAQVYAEAQKKLTLAFQQELKDAQAKELMYAEEANRLSKEIELEKQRALAALELEQEKAREILHKEMKHKEEETEFKLKKAELLSKTKIAAALAEEKLSYLNDVKNVKHELEALHMAFFTQSDGVRQSHTVHKLAVGTFALEDAMRRGVPVHKEVALICSSHGGAVSDPLLEAIISSIPEEAVKKGTMTPSQLQLKFETIKDEVLELSLIPATGGGLLSHAAAKMVSILKVKETGKYSDGLDAVVSQVQRSLTDGKLADAADLLEKGVQGTEAEVLAADWIKCVRERAVMEQILLLLQTHTTAVASSLA